MPGNIRNRASSPRAACRSVEPPAVRRRRAFSLVELLVVIGIVTILIGLLLPSLGRAKRQARQVACLSNLRQVGTSLMVYAHFNKGWVFPPLRHGGLPRPERWPNFVFKPAQWNPPVLLCPDDLEPAEEHSYVLNDHLYLHGVRYFSKNLGRPANEIVVMGEKRSVEGDYYMNRGDFDRVVEPYRHGPRLGSNYLFLDMHAGTAPKSVAVAGLDPWDVPATPQ
jgi:prepilin-type N-terminal cleavage/methylation domain-containing protein